MSKSPPKSRPPIFGRPDGFGSLPSNVVSWRRIELEVEAARRGRLEGDAADLDPGVRGDERIGLRERDEARAARGHDGEAAGNAERRLGDVAVRRARRPSPSGRPSACRGRVPSKAGPARRARRPGCRSSLSIGSKQPVSVCATTDHRHGPAAGDLPGEDVGFADRDDLADAGLVEALVDLLRERVGGVARQREVLADRSRAPAGSERPDGDLAARAGRRGRGSSSAGVRRPLPAATLAGRRCPLDSGRPGRRVGSEHRRLAGLGRPARARSCRSASGSAAGAGAAGSPWAVVAAGGRPGRMVPGVNGVPNRTSTRRVRSSPAFGRRAHATTAPPEAVTSQAAPQEVALLGDDRLGGVRTARCPRSGCPRTTDPSPCRSGRRRGWRAGRCRTSRTRRRRRRTCRPPG